MLNVLLCRTFFRSILLKNPVNVTRACSTSSSASNKPTLDFNDIKHPTKVPLKPIAPNTIKPEKVTIDKETIELLMRLSLVNLSDEEALRNLQDSIEFASKILHIDTAGLEPMYFVHENQFIELRDDIATEGNIREDLLKNAPVNDDVCFVAPPGNVPVELEEQEFKTTSEPQQ